MHCFHFQNFPLIKTSRAIIELNVDANNAIKYARIIVLDVPMLKKRRYRASAVSKSMMKGIVFLCIIKHNYSRLIGTKSVIIYKLLNFIY